LKKQLNPVATSWALGKDGCGAKSTGMSSPGKDVQTMAVASVSSARVVPAGELIGQQEDDRGLREQEAFDREVSRRMEEEGLAEQWEDFHELMDQLMDNGISKEKLMSTVQQVGQRPCDPDVELGLGALGY
jgi:hypothetical protein